MSKQGHWEAKEASPQFSFQASFGTGLAPSSMEREQKGSLGAAPSFPVGTASLFTLCQWPASSFPGLGSQSWGRLSQALESHSLPFPLGPGNRTPVWKPPWADTEGVRGLAACSGSSRAEFISLPFQTSPGVLSLWLIGALELARLAEVVRKWGREAQEWSWAVLLKRHLCLSPPSLPKPIPHLKPCQ